MRQILLDAREMEHPLPLQLALKHLQTISTDEYLYMIHRKKAVPLIEVAKEKNLSYHFHEEPNGTCHLLICKNREVELERFLDV